jgi:hypothetical protein
LNQGNDLRWHYNRTLSESATPDTPDLIVSHLSKARAPDFPKIGPAPIGARHPGLIGASGLKCSGDAMLAGWLIDVSNVLIPAIASGSSSVPGRGVAGR